MGIREGIMAPGKRVKVTRNHQTTVPKEAREKFGIHVGSVLEVVTTDEGVLYRPVQNLEDLAGCPSKYASVKMVKGSLERSRRVGH